MFTNNKKLGGKSMHKGMYNIKWYDKLNANSVKEFEQSLIKWARKNGEKANLIFDGSSLTKVSEMLLSNCEKGLMYRKGYIVADIPSKVRRMETDNLVIEWYTMCGDKCVLKSVTSFDGECYYYHPSKWEDSELWYAF